VVMYVSVYRRYVGRATLQQLLSGIAMALILQSLAQLAFSPDSRAIHDPWGSQYLVLGSIFLSYSQMVAFAVAVASVLAVEWALHFTRWGIAVRAVADDGEAAELVGQNANWINLSAFGLSAAMAGAAGAVLVTYLPVSPGAGFSLMPIAFIATVLGGLGSVGGAFLGGIICGVVEQLTSVFWNPSLQDLPLYLLLLIFLAWRQYGLFGRRAVH
jgi:branched-chain amino acid transport system permease protein